MIVDDVEILGDGEIVWVNGGPTGGAIGRFGKQGIDVHSLDTTSCLHCTHGPTSIADWFVFQEKMFDHHGVHVPDHLIPRRFYKDLKVGLRRGPSVLRTYTFTGRRDVPVVLGWFNYATFTGLFKLVEFPRRAIIWHELEMILGHGPW